MSTWPPPESEPPFAPIEDLDPEPAVRPRAGRRREQILGLGLLLVLAVFAATQWWDAQGRLTHYQAGSRAVATQDWDTAGREFAAANGFNDAATRATDATALRDERDRMYQALTGAVRDGEWPIALWAGRRLHDIATHYRDAPQLTSRAEEIVYAATLSGTVALRPHATPPGLYTYGASGWRYLQESDAGSQVRAPCPGGQALFDIPAGNGTAARRLVVAPLDGGPVRYRMDLELSRARTYLCTESGIWASVYYANSGFPGLLSGLSPAAILAYQPFGGSVILPSSPFAAGGIGLNVAPDGRYLLTAGVSGYSPAGAETRLYLVEPRTRDFRLLAIHLGWIDRAEVSPTGRDVLFIVDRLVSDNRRIATVLLLDTGGGPAQTLVEGAEDLDGDPMITGGLRATGAFFISTGPHAGQILLTWREGGGHRVQLLDPAAPARPLADWTVADGAEELRFFSTNVPDGGLLTGWQAPDGSRTTIAYLDGHNTIQLLDLPVPPGNLLWRAALRGDRLIYTTQQTSLVTRTTSYTVYSLALAPPPGRKRPPPVILHQAAVAEGQEPPATWTLGDTLFAYTTPAGELRAQTYNGSVDIPLESGVTALYNMVVRDTP